jgi:hypothetical protein
MRRPDGIALLSIYHFLVAGLSLLGCCVLAMVPFIVAVAVSPYRPGHIALPIVALVALLGLLLLLLYGAAHAAVGWGLWRLQPWSRLGAIVLAIVDLFAVPPISTAIGALALWYLFQPEARAALGEGVPTS